MVHTYQLFYVIKLSKAPLQEKKSFMPTLKYIYKSTYIILK